MDPPVCGMNGSNTGTPLLLSQHSLMLLLSAGSHRNPDDALNARAIHRLEWPDFSNFSQLTWNKCKHSRAKLLIHAYSVTQALLTYID